MNKTLAVRAMVSAAAICLLASLSQPIWKMRMEAPQYRDEEALRVEVYPNALRGDLGELKTLNQYIGVHTPDSLPQCRWLPVALVAGALLPLAGAFLPGKRLRTAVLLVSPLLLSAALGFAALQAQKQMHDIGHNRDKKTVLAGVKDFTPPLLGRAKIAQFEITSGLAFGSGLIAAAVGLQLAAAAVSRSGRPAAARRSSAPPRPFTSEPREVLA